MSPAQVAMDEPLLRNVIVLEFCRLLLNLKDDGQESVVRRPGGIIRVVCGKFCGHQTRQSATR